MNARIDVIGFLSVAGALCGACGTSSVPADRSDSLSPDAAAAALRAAELPRSRPAPESTVSQWPPWRYPPRTPWTPRVPTARDRATPTLRWATAAG